LLLGETQPDRDSNDGAYSVRSQSEIMVLPPLSDEERDNYIREFKPAFPIFPGIPLFSLENTIIKQVIEIDDMSIEGEGTQRDPRMGTETDELYPGYPRKKSIFATESLLDSFQEPNLYSTKAATKVNNKKMKHKLLPSKSGDDRPIFPHPDPLNLSATACKNHQKHIQDLDDSDCLDPCCTIKDYISLL
jgi:hypothetical protein